MRFEFLAIWRLVVALLGIVYRLPGSQNYKNKHKSTSLKSKIDMTVMQPYMIYCGQRLKLKLQYEWSEVKKL